MKKLLITGSKGFLGQRLHHHYQNQFQVFALGHQDLEISNRESTLQIIRDIRPDIIFHCAAISDTGYAQNHPEESETINLKGSIHIAEAAFDLGCRLVYMSSDQVYNGSKTILPGKETDLLEPKSIYGIHKLEAEKAIQEILPDAVGLRLTWMYDNPESRFKMNRNLPVNLLQAFQNKETLRAATREFRGITNVWEVVSNMQQCLEIPGGVYNYGSGNLLNSYETFIQFARTLQLPNPEEWIIADSERFADHPRNLLMDTQKAEDAGIHFNTTVEGFRQCFL